MADPRAPRVDDLFSEVHAALSAFAEGFGPWMENLLGTWPPDRSGLVAPQDPQYLVRILLDRWLTDFVGPLGQDHHIQVHNVRTLRNQWAHHALVDADAARRGVLSCADLLRSIGSSRADEVASIARRLGGDASPIQRLRLHQPRRPSGHRRMSDPEFREEQWRRRFDPHVAPINELVDRLIEEHGTRWMPYSPPYHGGIAAEIVLLYQDPGRMTATEFGGSGFLGCENDDPSAELVATCLDHAGLRADQVIPWNSYPWFLPDQGGVTARMLDEGTAPLRDFLALLPQAHTIVLGGRKAQGAWPRFVRRHPGTARPYRAIETFHTSGRGITNGGRQTKAEGVAHVVAALREAAGGG